MRETSVVIVQPYVPEYRVPFFTQLVGRLAEHNVTCNVAAPRATRDQLRRKDASFSDWQVEAQRQEIPLGSRSLILGGSRPTWNRANAVILPCQGSSVDTFNALLRRPNDSFRVGLWGHIRDYVNKPNRVDQRLEEWQLRHADHVFAYTPGGEQHAQAVGVLPRQITTVMNSTDTLALSAAMEDISREEIATFARGHGLRENRTLAYIGGLDASKRIDFFVKALDEIWRRAPDIKVLVAGRGAHEHLLDVAVKRGQVALLGYANTRTKTLIAHVSSAMLMPGRIGLVAVDALVMKLPVLTTDWPYHAPEVEYLTEGATMFSSSNDPIAFAELATNTLARSSEWQDSEIDWSHPTLGAMVDNFTGGILTMLER